MSRPPVSYYRATVAAEASRPPLSGLAECDTCVVGGGFAGLGTALSLAERGLRDVVLLEAMGVGHGASGRNGGFVFAGFSLGEDRLLRDLGAERARNLYRGTMDAVELVRTRTRRHGIDCDRVDAGVLWANWFDDPGVLRERQRLLAEHYGVDWQWVPRERLRELLRSDRYSDGLFEPGAFHFHPLKYALGVARAAEGLGVRIHEQTPAVELRRDGSGWRIDTPQGTVRARQLVLACGGYLAGLRRRVDAAILPKRLEDARRAHAGADAHRHHAVLLLAVRRRPCTMVAARTAPVAPSGWPSAIAPPSGLTLSGSSPNRGSPPAPAPRRPR
jgi:gamma-glutamylputrescine oxidase